jgi:hypothetical protein
VETSTNPFEQGKSLVGLGNKVEKTPFKKQRQKLSDRIEQEKYEGKNCYRNNIIIKKYF